MGNTASVRSLEGWSAVMGLRRPGEKALIDERILGSTDLLPSMLTAKQAQQIIAGGCKKERIFIQELQRGSRRGPIPRVRSHSAWKLARELKVPLAEVRRRLRVSTSTISQFLEREQIC
jgi:hypothetical protein